MTWNNRIFRHNYEVKPGEWEAMYHLHEVYYDEEGKMDGYTENPMTPRGETVEELIEHLEQLLNDAKRSKEDVLDYEEEERKTEEKQKGKEKMK